MRPGTVLTQWAVFIFIVYVVQHDLRDGQTPVGCVLTVQGLWHCVEKTGQR